MLIREIRPEEKSRFNKAVDHPLQSWQWGEFRTETGVAVERIGFFRNGRMENGMQVTFHPLPDAIPGNYTIGYFPKGPMPDEEQLSALRQVGKKHNAIFIKMEPNIAQKVGKPSAHDQIVSFLTDNGAEPGKPMFTKHTFQLDLTQSEEKIFSNLKSKTRYNVRQAYKAGVQIIEDSSREGLETYLQILDETTKRQGFYAHDRAYFEKMWEALKDTDVMRVFHAVYDDTVLVSWIMFVFNRTLYYPYGASRDVHRDVMASNLMMWEMIRFGKAEGCSQLDMWGSLGPDPNKNDPWYGFHRFKEGYGGDLVEFVGTYDLVLEDMPYRLFRIANDIRWRILKLKAQFT